MKSTRLLAIILVCCALNVTSYITVALNMLKINVLVVVVQTISIIFHYILVGIAITKANKRDTIFLLILLAILLGLLQALISALGSTSISLTKISERKNILDSTIPLHF